MDLLTSGRFTSNPLLSACILLFNVKRFVLLHICMHVLITSLLVFSALGGSHGVPRVHYKGRQGDYYVMVSSGSFKLITL